MGPADASRPQHRFTCHIQLEVLPAGHGYHLSVIDSGVKGIHGEGGGAVYDAVPRVQDTAHEQVYQLVGAATHLQEVNSEERHQR